MSESEPRPPWYDRPLFSNIIGACVAAFFIWFVPWAIGQATTAKVPFWVYVAMLIAALAVTSVVLPVWRHAIWGRVGRGLKWLWSWHPVSARTFRASQERQNDGIDKFFAANLPAFVRKIIADDEKTKAEMKELFMPIFERRAAAMIEAQKAEAQKAEASVEDIWATPVIDTSPPLPTPRWAVEMASETSTEDFILANYVPRSVAREVRIEGDNDIAITSAGQWEDLSGNSRGRFSGQLSTDAYSRGVNFYISWFDENSARQTATVFLMASTINKSTPF